MSYYLILVILSIVFLKYIPIKYKVEKRISSKHLKKILHYRLLYRFLSVMNQ
jgi:hypothetical protein